MALLIAKTSKIMEKHIFNYSSIRKHQNLPSRQAIFKQDRLTKQLLAEGNLDNFLKSL